MTAEMRVLTVRQPWAWAIIHGGKDVENRVRNLAGNYRGAVAIHAGLQFDDNSWDAPKMGNVLNDLLARNQEVTFTPGAIIGVVDLIGVHHNSHPQGCAPDDQSVGKLKFCSPWAEPGSWHLGLANPRPLTVPIEWKGALGLRRLPAETVELIMELQHA